MLRRLPTGATTTYTNDHQNGALHAGLFSRFDENVGQKNCHSNRERTTGTSISVTVLLCGYVHHKKANLLK